MFAARRCSVQLVLLTLMQKLSYRESWNIYTGNSIDSALKFIITLELTRLSIFVTLADAHRTSSSSDSLSTTSESCEVHDLPAGCTAEMLTLIFEDEKFTGIAGAKVVDVELVDDSHAIITFSSHEGFEYYWSFACSDLLCFVFYFVFFVKFCSVAMVFWLLLSFQVLVLMCFLHFSILNVCGFSKSTFQFR